MRPGMISGLLLNDHANVHQYYFYLPSGGFFFVTYESLVLRLWQPCFSKDLKYGIHRRLEHPIPYGLPTKKVIHDGSSRWNYFSTLTK